MQARSLLAVKTALSPWCQVPNLLVDVENRQGELPSAGGDLSTAPGLLSFHLVETACEKTGMIDCEPFRHSVDAHSAGGVCCLWKFL